MAEVVAVLTEEELCAALVQWAIVSHGLPTDRRYKVRVIRHRPKGRAPSLSAEIVEDR